MLYGQPCVGSWGRQPVGTISVTVLFTGVTWLNGTQVTCVSDPQITCVNGP